MLGLLPPVRSRPEGVVISTYIYIYTCIYIYMCVYLYIYIYLCICIVKCLRPVALRKYGAFQISPFPESDR